MIARFLLVAGLVLFAQTGWTKDVYYALEKGRVPEASIDFRVLKLVLSKADGEWTLKPTPAGAANQKRQLGMLQAGEELHVVSWGMSPEYEEKLDAVYIPITGGLLGWRLMLIDGDRQSDFSEVQTLEDLQAFVMGQGRGWGDVPILEAAGLKVQTSEYRNLFRMVAGGRIDAFPRGAGEALNEVEAFGPNTPGLAVEQDLVVRYPFAKFFFVSPKHPDLHAAIKQGFERAHEDGSYRELFLNDSTVRGVLDSANLGGRRLIEIENPNLSDKTRAIPERYWFVP